MQLMFEASDEGAGEGLGLFSGRVTQIDARQLPQIGWNTLDDVTDVDLRAATLETAYYANSYVCRPEDSSVVSAWSSHGNDRFPASVRTARTVGVQFHPESVLTEGGHKMLAEWLVRCGDLDARNLAQGLQPVIPS
jgi:glutamine amidotransferase